MKKLSSKMKVLLVLAICTAFIVPSVALAGEKTRVLVNGEEFANGEYTLPVNSFKSLSSLNVTDKTNKLEFEVVNGDNSGKTKVSSAKIVLQDEKGKKGIVAISPNQFNQNVDMARGILVKEDLEGLTDFTLAIKVKGPKDGFIVLTVTEYYEGDAPCPWYDQSCND